MHDVEKLLENILFMAYREHDALKAIKLKVLHDDIKERFFYNYEKAHNYYKKIMDTIRID